MTTNKHTTLFQILLAALLVLTVGCGTTTGNGRITVTSATFATAGFLDSIRMLTTTVTDFKICVKKIQLKNDQDVIQQKEGADDIDFPAGLINLTAGAATSWGTVEVPVNFTLKRVKVHIHKDQDLCGVNYSVKFNSFSTNQNLVVKHIFNPPVALTAGNTVELNFESLVNALRAAADDGSLNNNTLRDKIEEIEGSAKKP